MKIQGQLGLCVMALGALLLFRSQLVLMNQAASRHFHADIGRSAVPKEPPILCDKYYNVMMGIPDVMTSGNCTSSCSKYTCERLMFNIHSDTENQQFYKEVEQWMYKNIKKRRHEATDESHIGRTSDCPHYVKTTGYITSPGEEEERDFPIAYNILMHFDIEQLEKLLKAIYRPQNSYCIHLDAKAPEYLVKSVASLVRCFTNVFQPFKEERVIYGGFSRLQADINCMTDHVKRPENWKYLINLAAQAFPIKSNPEIVKILRLFNGSNDIEAVKFHTQQADRYRPKRVEMYGAVVRTAETNPVPPHNLQIVKGSAYGTFSRAFVEFLLTDQKAKDLLEWSKTTYSPDEHYWATLNHLDINPQLNTPGGYSGVAHKKPWLSSYSAWYPRDRSSCRGTWQRTICVFGVGDLPTIKDRPELFVNKVSLYFQPVVIDCLGRWIKYLTMCPRDLNHNNYYRELPFVTNSNSSRKHLVRRKHWKSQFTW